MKSKLLLITLFQFIATFSQAQSNWSALESGITSSLYGVDFLDENIGMAVGDSGVILRTYDGGQAWEKVNSGVTQCLNSISFIDAKNIIAVGDDALILKSQDGGNSWFSQFVEGITDADLLSVDMSASGKGIVTGQYMTLITTTDGFDHRLIIRKNYTGGFFSARILDEDNAFVFGVNAISQSVIYKVAHFDSLSTARFYDLFNGQVWATSVAYDGYAFNNDSVLTVGYLEGDNPAGLSSYITRDQPWDSEYWQPLYSVDSAWYYSVDFNGNYGVAVGGKIQVLKYDQYNLSESFDQGKTWSAVVSPVTEYLLNDVKLINTVGYIVGDGGLIMKADLPTTVIETQTSDCKFRIYPNPASDFCMANLFLSDNANVTFSIYSADGKIVRSFPMGYLSAGSHEFRLNVDHLTRGFYFCTLTAGDQIITKKISIVK